jgi:Fe-S-cluster containining protein
MFQEGFKIFRNERVHVTFDEKKKRLKEIYDNFETEVKKYKESAVCRPGCAFCCIHFGSVDITSLEGLIIRERVNGFAKPLKNRIKKKISQNKKLKENQKSAECPFLKEDKTCLIYDSRPFSCRQLYSLRECDGKGPTVHRQAVDLAQKTVKKLQQLDSNGYSGHISFILHLLDKKDFRDFYLAGGFSPSQIMGYGKTHDIIINSPRRLET